MSPTIFPCPLASEKLIYKIYDPNWSKHFCVWFSVLASNMAIQSNISTNTFPQVDEEDIEEMFSYADKDKDGKISYLEFQAMINPPKPPTEPTTSLTPTPVKRVTIKTTEKDEDLVDIIDTALLADAEDKLMTPVTTK